MSADHKDKSPNSGPVSGENSGEMSKGQQDKLANVLNRDHDPKKQKDLPPIGPEGKIPPEPEEKIKYRVEFTGPEDVGIPYNWPLWAKFSYSAVLVFSSLVATWGSAIYGCGLYALKEEYSLGVTPVELGTSLYVLGFGFGPVLWGPLSERYGRQRPLAMGMFLFTCFTFATATGKDVQTIMICRFWSGLCGASTIAVVPAYLGDFFLPSDRTAIGLYSLSVLGGPMLAPVAGEYMLQAGLSWRWLLYTTGMGGAVAAVLLAMIPESFQPIILADRAAILRRETGNWALHAQHDAIEADFREIVQNTVLRPLRMIVSEPILLFLSLYQGIVYTMLYMCLQVEGIPLIFENYGWTGAKTYLPFLAVFAGAFIFILVGTYVIDVQYNRLVEKSPYKVIPEARLVMLSSGSVLMCISMFWLFWTGAYPKTEATPHGCHWMVPTVGLFLFGFSFGATFLPITNYLLDSYMLLAASAMAGNELVRDLLACGWPLFTAQMFTNLGIQWAGTLLAGLVMFMTPLSFLLWAFGKKLRKKSTFALSDEDARKER